MTQRIPVRLRKEPLLEAVWEIRFRSSRPSVADLLPGLIYKGQSGAYPRIVRLPAADIPAPVAERDSAFRYVPKIRLEGSNQAIQIGGHAVSLSCRRPYLGWKNFSSDIRTLIGLIRETALIDQLERFSLKYLDLIELDQPPSLSCLNMELKLGGHEITTRPLNLRTEIREESVIHIVQIVSPAEAAVPGESKRLAGVLLDIDTIHPMKENESWGEVEVSLDHAHSAAKRIFFSLLTNETVEKLEPEY